MADLHCTVYTKDGKFQLTFDQWWDFDENKLHRDDDKPAIIYKNGYKAWYKNGKFHREDGPAIIWSDQAKSWYIDNQIYTKQQHNKIIKEALSQTKSMGLTDNRWWVRDYYINKEKTKKIDNTI